MHLSLAAHPYPRPQGLRTPGAGHQVEVLAGSTESSLPLQGGSVGGQGQEPPCLAVRGRPGVERGSPNQSTPPTATQLSAHSPHSRPLEGSLCRPLCGSPVPTDMLSSPPTSPGKTQAGSHPPSWLSPWLGRGTWKRLLVLGFLKKVMKAKWGAGLGVTPPCSPHHPAPPAHQGPLFPPFWGPGSLLQAHNGHQGAPILPPPPPVWPDDQGVGGHWGAARRGPSAVDGPSRSRWYTGTATPAGQALTFGFLKGVGGGFRQDPSSAGATGRQTPPEWLRGRERGS